MRPNESKVHLDSLVLNSIVVIADDKYDGGGQASACCEWQCKVFNIHNILSRRWLVMMVGIIYWSGF